MSLTIKRELDDLNDFEFWGGAVARWEEIQELGLEDDVMIYLEEHQDYLTETELNDFVWFELDDFIEEMKEEQEETE